jgi:hypothetical protein
MAGGHTHSAISSWIANPVGQVPLVALRPELGSYLRLNGLCRNPQSVRRVTQLSSEIARNMARMPLGSSRRQ